MHSGKVIRQWWLAVLLLAPVALVPSCAKEGSGNGSIQHVILISLDTTRADHLGFLGNPTVRTPHLDALAEKSVVFTDHMTVVPTTLASHASLFTGKYPHNHGTPRNGFTVNDGNMTLAEMLNDAGFHTAGFIGSFALDSRFGISQGFDHYDESFSILVGDGGVDQNQRSAAEVTDAVITYLDGVDPAERLFLFAHYFDPHRPYAPPPPYNTMYDPKGSDALPSIDDILGDQKMPVDDKRKLLRRHEFAYAGEISYMDHHIGRLLDYLENKGILENSLVVVTSDHGENFTAHPMFFNHGFSVFQTTMRAAFVLYTPQWSAGFEHDDLTASIDILPTLLDLLELPLPTGVDGQTIEMDKPATTNPPVPRVRFGQATKPIRAETDPRWANILKARFIRAGRYKLIEVPYSRGQALFDLTADPGETRNLLEDPSPQVARLAQQLRDRLRSWAVDVEPLESTFDDTQREETLERLKSLGYIND